MPRCFERNYVISNVARSTQIPHFQGKLIFTLNTCLYHFYCQFWQSVTCKFINLTLCNYAVIKGLCIRIFVDNIQTVWQTSRVLKMRSKKKMSPIRRPQLRLSGLDSVTSHTAICFCLTPHNWGESSPSVISDTCVHVTVIITTRPNCGIAFGFHTNALYKTIYHVAFFGS